MSATETKISIRVHPNAARSELAGFTDGILQVRVTAPPVKGRANKEAIAVLSKSLDVSRGTLTIIRGHTGRNKVVAITGLSREEVMARLSPSSSGGATK